MYTKNTKYKLKNINIGSIIHDFSNTAEYRGNLSESLNGNPWELINKWQIVHKDSEYVYLTANYANRVQYSSKQIPDIKYQQTGDTTGKQRFSDYPIWHLF